jgi:predicted transcriptional regulator
VTVTGQTAIVSNSFAEAFMMADSTSDNTVTDHQLAGVMFRIVCGDIVEGTGFTIYVTSIGGLVTGDFSIKWVWS